MSKTVVIMEAPDSITGVDQISDEHQFFLGAFGEVVGALRQVFPNADFSDPTSILVQSGEDHIKIDINKHTPVQNFTISSEGQIPLNQILSLCKKTGWRALDTDTGLFLDKAEARAVNRRKRWWKFWNR